MRKVLSAFLVASVLLLCAAPVFCVAATAPFTFNAGMIQPSQDSNKLYYVLANNASEGICIQISSTFVQYMDPYSPGLSYDSSLGFYFETILSQSGTYFVDVTVFDLATGNIKLNKSETKTNQSHITIYFGVSGFNGSAYAYSLYGAPLSSYYFVHVDPFVTWFDPDNPPYVPPDDPIDPTSVVRSLLPRPLGTTCTFYIADHLYLYSIFVGVPQQFEYNGIISDIDPNHITGDNYNVFDLTFKSSGSTLNFTITNRAEFSYNVIITKYDVVDGSFISSQPHSVVSATDSSTPGVLRFSVELSDPSSYGIYQSGFFARSHSVPYPELRISWSDTIDYSLDFFVIRQGLVTIVQNQVSMISNFQTANSTLSTISSTSSSILSKLTAFYNLVDSNFTWLKTTFYDNLNNKWTITNNYLLSIYNLLNETDETMTIEDDTSGVAAMESAKNDLVVTNAAGQAVDAGDAAAAGLSEAAQQIGEIAQPVGTINQLMQTIVFDKPKLLLPVIVALGLGLMVTILGKNKSD